MTHKEWLDNEYDEWVKALQESTVHNFKEHPVVKRMLGEPDVHCWGGFIWNGEYDEMLTKIDVVGYTHPFEKYNTRLKRMVYYAFQVLNRNPTSICEIGGGVGQFYAILRALGWKGKYDIIDLPEVFKFQKKYLAEVNKQTGLNTELTTFEDNPEMVVSFYALGEFFDELKNSYFDLIVNFCKHGYIAWNPHSGASDDLSLFKYDIKVTPGIEPGITIIEW